VFCQRIKRGEFDREWVSRRVHGVVFSPLNPVTRGHVLVVPSVHVPHAAFDPKFTAEVMRCAAELADVVGDCNIITSVGPAATQTVEHLHVHVVPRRPGDGLLLPWTGQHVTRAVTDAEIDAAVLVLTKETDIGGYASGGDFTDEQIAAGDLARADARAAERVRDTVRRALIAARDTR
jgi:histidine triad (HIT) family protein